jgi:cysteine synthase
MAQPDPTYLHSSELPRLIRLDNLVAAVFTLMKLLPARHIIESARKSGELAPGGTIIETSSGTFGLALAMVARLQGHRLFLVSDPAIEPPLQRRLEDLGAIVDIVRQPAATGGFQRARLDRVAALHAEHPGAFLPSQYNNPRNPEAYRAVAAQLTRALPRVDCLVGTVGSGGSLCGTASGLRETNPDLTLVGADSLGSVLFGQPDAGSRLLRGLGNSLMPRNLDHRAFDEVHWVSAAEGFLATRELHRRHALYMGPTSGVAYMAARDWARRNPDKTVVVFMADEGYRYQDSVYDDRWLRDRDVALPSLSDLPQLVSRPLEATTSWARMQWGRRSYADATGHEYRGIHS